MCLFLGVPIAYSFSLIGHKIVHKKLSWAMTELRYCTDHWECKVSWARNGPNRRSAQFPRPARSLASHPNSCSPYYVFKSTFSDLGIFFTWIGLTWELLVCYSFV